MEETNLIENEESTEEYSFEGGCGQDEEESIVEYAPNPENTVPDIKQDDAAVTDLAMLPKEAGAG